ncbi:hypothetical protein NE236_40685 [Actinoallomurus purpureus]|uniref:hypothetical protein n=1 Tax=Actinoallomurus purpureus TaxID=478114 RepID=UPI002093C404|nr:hypothetical protein [Actinoallomurus purpureus]MCO6011286.1 hypothetical protein [Actinoallomurus purpureus]
MRRAKRPAVAMVGLAVAGAMALAFDAAGATSAFTTTTTPHHVVAGHTGDGCDNWGDCWDTWGGGGDSW